jgi:regulation of enolase protein 1 (concanavalin A-like superfamily)
MFRTLSPVLLLLVAITVGIAAPVKEKKAQTIKGWDTVVDPDRDCKVTLDDGKVTITVPTTRHDLSIFEKKPQHNAPRVLQEVKGDFHARVKVRLFPQAQANTASGGNLSFISSGLLLWIDDDNYLRLERGSCGESGGGRPFIEAEHWQGGRMASFKSIPLSEDRDTWLRIERNEDKLTLSFGDDGKEWHDALAVEVKLPENVKVGVHAINTTTVTFSPTLEEFKVEKK